MTLKEIKQIIYIIAKKKYFFFYNDRISYNHHLFKNVIDFLAEAVYFKFSFQVICCCNKCMIYLTTYHNLELTQFNKKWHLGYYYEHQKRRKPNFNDFFDYYRLDYIIYFINLKNNKITFTEKLYPKDIRLSVEKSIENINDEFDYQYNKKLIDVLTKFANTDIKLKITFDNIKHKNQVMFTKIYVCPLWTGYSVIFNNENRNAWFPKNSNYRQSIFSNYYDNRKGFINMEQKIIEIAYKDKILFKDKNFTKKQIKNRQKYLSKKISKALSSTKKYRNW